MPITFWGRKWSNVTKLTKAFIKHPKYLDARPVAVGTKRGHAEEEIGAFLQPKHLIMPSAFKVLGWCFSSQRGVLNPDSSVSLILRNVRLKE